jgi:hypothetical protein
MPFTFASLKFPADFTCNCPQNETQKKTVGNEEFHIKLKLNPIKNETTHTHTHKKTVVGFHQFN